MKRGWRMQGRLLTVCPAVFYAHRSWWGSSVTWSLTTPSNRLVGDAAWGIFNLHSFVYQICILFPQITRFRAISSWSGMKRQVSRCWWTTCQVSTNKLYQSVLAWSKLELTLIPLLWVYLPETCRTADNGGLGCHQRTEEGERHDTELELKDLKWCFIPMKVGNVVYTRWQHVGDTPWPERFEELASRLLKLPKCDD